MNKGGKLLKEIVVLRRWESITDNLVLTTELKTLISHREEFEILSKYHKTLRTQITGVPFVWMREPDRSHR